VLTEVGRETILSLAHGEAELLSERMSELSPEDRDLLRSAMPVLRHLAEPQENK
jgi:hypothetical protein